MILTLTLALVASAPAAPRSTAVRADDPPIHVWLNSDNTFTTGDRARVHIRAEQDGYVVVLRADGDGRVRVLFPLDPGSDDFVRGGDKREVRGRGDREAFLVDEREGGGVVLAAWSSTAFKFDEFVRGDHWDYRALDTRQSGDDREAALVDIVQHMAGENRFDYDVVTYTVGSIAAYYHRPYYGGYGWGGWGWPYGRRFRIGIGIGYPYYGGYGCDSFWGGYGCGFYDPFFYSGYYYRPYRAYGFVGVRTYQLFGGSLFGRMRTGFGGAGGFGGIQPRPRYSVATTTTGRTIMSRFPTSSSSSTGTRVRERSFSGGTSGGSGFARSGSTATSRRDSHESWSGRSRSSGGSSGAAPSYRGGGSTSSSRGGGWSGAGGGGRSGGGGGRSGGGGGRRH